MYYVRGHVVLAFGSLFLCSLHAQTQLGWPLAGMDVTNSRFGASEWIINTSNVGTLQPQWTYTTAGNVSATPSYDGLANAVYFPDWAGNIVKLNATNGALIWQHNVTEYGLPKGALSRNTPTLAGGLVIFGASGALGSPIACPGYLMAIDPDTGDLVWQIIVDPDLDALMTGSPMVYNNVIYVGVSSSQEVLTNPTFRGSVVALSVATGSLLWQTYMVPAGYSGGPVWSSTPAVDVSRNQLYVTTGNNYLVPQSVQWCEQAASTPSAVVACQAPTNMADSIVALDLTSGAIKWSHRGQAQDNFITACNKVNTNACPDPRGEDWDFGAGANFFTCQVGGLSSDVVGAGEKSGVYWALNPDNGHVLWRTKVGPGGILGGIQWGTAVDGQYVYVAVSNSRHTTYKLEPSGMNWNGGSWAALSPATGEIVWQVPDPGLDPLNPNLPADSMGPVTVANGVLYAGSSSGAMYGFDTSSGNTLWSFQAAGSVISAPSVFDGVLYWGSGYRTIGQLQPISTPSNQFYSFALPANNSKHP